jgi:hypothetical protein
VRPVLRRFLVGAIVVASIAALGIGWVATAFLFSPCQYDLTHERVSPSQRYVAEVYGATCGMGSYRSVVTLRDRSALALQSVDETPPGTIVANDFTLAQQGEDLFWDGESKLVLQYVGVNAPELDRSEWGGVRIETRRFQHQP